jgi:hypothetical protein
MSANIGGKGSNGSCPIKEPEGAPECARLLLAWYTDGMLETPTIPAVFGGGDVGTISLAGLPVLVEVSPAALIVIFALVALYAAALTVVLVYHWRRFPFEHVLFKNIEHFYAIGHVLFLGCALVAILLTL